MKNWGIDKCWEQFCLCVVAHMILPFMPLFFELWKTGTIGPTSLTISTAMYAISIGLSSKISLITLMCTIVAFVFSFAYGDSVDRYKHSTVDPELLHLEAYAFICIALIFASHFLERYVRHVLNGEDFMSFASRSEEGSAG